jgi:DUF4097 and DUF4098 domain-containing protein YvlB
MASEKWLIDGAKVIDVERVRKLKVSLIAGKVDIVGHDEPGARIEVHSVSGKELKVSIDGETLEIDHPQLSWDNFIEVFSSFRGSAKADVSIMVPRDIALSFGVVSASALINGLTTDASISSVNGDLVIDGLTGALQINSVSGEIAVSSHTGRVSARTVSGDITASGDVSVFTAETVSGDVLADITGIPDEVRISTVSGDITASGDVSVFTAETVSGDVLADITGIPDEVRISTVSGAVTTRLAAGVPVQYKINTVGGKLQLDDSEIKGVHGQYTGKYGTLDAKWLDFKANTVSGNINVLHAVSV